MQLKWVMVLTELALSEAGVQQILNLLEEEVLDLTAKASALLNEALDESDDELCDDVKRTHALASEFRCKTIKKAVRLLAQNAAHIMPLECVKAVILNKYVDFDKVYMHDPAAVNVAPLANHLPDVYTLAPAPTSSISDAHTYLVVFDKVMQFTFKFYQHCKLEFKKYCRWFSGQVGRRPNQFKAYKVYTDMYDSIFPYTEETRCNGQLNLHGLVLPMPLPFDMGPLLYTGGKAGIPVMWCHQYPGETVVIPSGVAHQVVNAHPMLKFASDFILLCKLNQTLVVQDLRVDYYRRRGHMVEDLDAGDLAWVEVRVILTLLQLGHYLAFP
ncbi:hypothetical protein JCM1840_000801 [Sporobolomyces johnsonii]